MRKETALLGIVIAASVATSACSKGEVATSKASAPFSEATAVIPHFRTNAVQIPDFDADHLEVAYKDAVIQGQRIKTITTSKLPYSYAAMIQIPSARLPKDTLVAIRHRVVKGQVGFGVVDQQQNEFLSRMFVEHEDKYKITYLPLLPAQGARMLIIENGKPASGVSQVLIGRIELVAPVATH